MKSVIEHLRSSMVRVLLSKPTTCSSDKKKLHTAWVSLRRQGGVWLFLLVLVEVTSLHDIQPEPSMNLRSP